MSPPQNVFPAYLAGLGIAGDRVVVVSKGKESPVCTDSNEACWQQNRRGHFVITALGHTHRQIPLAPVLYALLQAFQPIKKWRLHKWFGRCPHLLYLVCHKP